MRKLWILAAIALGACSTQAAPVRRAAPAPAAPAPPAGDLPHLARTVAAQLDTADPQALAAVELELRRISDALPGGAPALRQSAMAEQSAAPVAAAPEPAPAPGYAPPPDLRDARSLYSALTLGAYPNPDTARAAWFGMNAAHGQALAGLDARMEAVARETGADAFLLKAGPFQTAQEADALCARLRQAGAVCSAGDFTGEPL